MFEKIKKGLVRLDCWLRNTTPREECRTVPFESLFEERHDPIRTRVYWFAYRNGRRIWNAPGNAVDEVRYAWQRVFRGWDDRAVWSIDYWLDAKMPAMLRRLKETKHGVPSSMFTPEDCIPQGEWQGNPSEEGMKRAGARWDAIVDKMIAGFEASARVKEGLYEDELGPYPDWNPPEGVSKEEWKAQGDARFAASRLLEERDVKIHKEGMALFAEHYWSLWD
jgi:hypothetical protein